MGVQAYNNTDELASYKKIVSQILPTFSASGSPNLANDVVALEKELAAAVASYQNPRYVQSYNPMSVKETESLLPQIHYDDIISHFAPSDYHADRLIIDSPPYLEAVSNILCNTPRETVQAFLKWRVIDTYAPNVIDSKMKPLQDLISQHNPYDYKERWKTCVSKLETPEDLGWILARFYVMKWFPPSSKKLGTRIVSDLKDRFYTVLGQTTWLSEGEKKEGIQKVKNIDVQMGYPSENPNTTDASSVQQYYADIKITDNFFTNELSVAKSDLNRQWSKLGKPPPSSDWQITAPAINGAFRELEMYIFFTAAVMQPPVFYGPTAPGYVNYGLFGASAGHELSHGRFRLADRRLR